MLMLTQSAHLRSLSCECETSGGLWITVHCRHFIWMPTDLFMVVDGRVHLI